MIVNRIEIGDSYTYREHSCKCRAEETPVALTVKKNWVPAHEVPVRLYNPKRISCGLVGVDVLKYI